jgi:hypothetical protein
MAPIMGALSARAVSCTLGRGELVVAVKDVAGPSASGTSRIFGGSELFGSVVTSRGGVGDLEMAAVPVSPSSRRQKMREPFWLMRKH